MKIKHIIYILAASVFVTFWSCEKDILTPEFSDDPIEQRAKGGKGKTEAITVLDLGTLGGMWSHAYDVNIVDGIVHVVGHSETALGEDHAFLWTENGGMTDLGVLDPTVPHSVANAINSSGVIVGYSWTFDSPWNVQKAVKWVDGTITSINDNQSSAYDINANGDITGTDQHLHIETGTVPPDTFAINHAFVWWADGSTTDLGGSSDDRSSALGINDAGTVTGEHSIWTDGVEDKHAFQWTAANGMQDINPLVGATSRGHAVNNVNQLVGLAFEWQIWWKAVLWENDEFMFLPFFGRTEAYDISESGWVAGFSRRSGKGGNKNIAFIWKNPDTELTVLKAAKGGRGDSFAKGIVDVFEDGQVTHLKVVGYNEVHNNMHAVLWTVDLSLL